MDKVLPVDGQGEGNRKPWLLYSLGVNTLNFCAFGMCVAKDLSGREAQEKDVSIGTQLEKKESGEVEDLLIAVPNTLTSEAVSNIEVVEERNADINRLTSFTSHHAHAS